MAGLQRIRFGEIRRGDLLTVIEHRTARRVQLRAERFVHDGIDTFVVCDGEQEVRAIIEYIQRSPDSLVLCGRTEAVSGVVYPPCARPAEHREAYCRSAAGDLFLAADTRRTP